MTNFFDRLIARTTGDGPLLQPRSPTRFGADPAEEHASRLDAQPPIAARPTPSLLEPSGEPRLAPNNGAIQSRSPATPSAEDDISIPADREDASAEPRNQPDQGRAARSRPARQSPPQPLPPSTENTTRPFERQLEHQAAQPVELPTAHVAEQLRPPAADPIAQTSVARPPPAATSTPNTPPLEPAPTNALARSASEPRHHSPTTSNPWNAPPSRELEAPAAPVIIEIGSIEFHAPPPPTAPSAPPPAPRRPELSLGDYLARRARTGT